MGVVAIEPGAGLSLALAFERVNVGAVKISLGLCLHADVVRGWGSRMARSLVSTLGSSLDASSPAWV
jgi:hypothetical protein